MAKKTKNKGMDQEKFNYLAGTVFIIAGSLHLFRLIYGWDLILDSYVIPKFISILAVIITLYLALQAFKITK